MPRAIIDRRYRMPDTGCWEAIPRNGEVVDLEKIVLFGVKKDSLILAQPDVASWKFIRNG